MAVPIVALVLIGTSLVQPAAAVQQVLLGTAAPFAVLGGTAVTDVPTSSITGNVGLSPAAGTNYAGLTQAEVNGTIYSTDGTGPTGNVDDPALLTTAKNDLTTAYVVAQGLPPTTTFSAGDNQLGGKTLAAGVYAFGHAATANITAASPLVLDGQGNPNAVFVFQASSDLVTASGSAVELVNGAQACNVFWQVTSSATLSSSTSFVGTIMALTSATLDTGATVQGRVLARNGEVTLDANTITTPSACTVAQTTTSTTAAVTTTTSSGGGATTTTVPTTSTTPVVPTGYPHTGIGGAAHARNGYLIAAGALALAGSAAAMAMAVRRRWIGAGRSGTGRSG